MGGHADCDRTRILFPGNPYTFVCGICTRDCWLFGGFWSDHCIRSKRACVVSCGDHLFPAWYFYLSGKRTAGGNFNGNRLFGGSDRYSFYAADGIDLYVGSGIVQGNSMALA